MIIVAATPSVDFTAAPDKRNRRNEQQREETDESSANLNGSLHIRSAGILPAGHGGFQPPTFS